MRHNGTRADPHLPGVSVAFAGLVSLAVLVMALPGCGESRPTPRIDRVPPVRATGATPDLLALPAEWSARYPATPDDTGLARREVDGAAAAAAAVRDGGARYALTVPSHGAGLATSAFDAVPVAFVVPLTFAVEELTAAQARDLAGGRIRNWREVGGPDGAVTVEVPATAEAAAALARALEAAIVAAGSAAGDARPRAGTLRLEIGSGPALGTKALRIDGHLPDEPGYPFVDRRVVAGAAADAGGTEAVAECLRRQLAAARPAAITLDAVGDIMLGREVGRLIAERGPAYPFAAVQPLLARADLRIGNLELPLTERGTPSPKDYVFRAPPAVVSGLTYAGFSVLTLANNHALDYGPEGLLDTIAALDGAGIAHAGAGRTPEEAHAPAIVTVKGLRIAVLAYVNVPNDGRSGFVAESMAAAAGRPGVAWGRADAVRRDVAAARAKADLVIVCMHSGYEYTATPNPIQRELAHAAVDAGAALVVGAHPHVLQGVEFYRGVPIIYSLGNFVFDLDDDDRRQPGLPSLLSVIVRVTLTAQGVRGVQFLPVVIDAREGRPLLVTGAAARPVLDRLYRLTDALN
jgi:poly-gamma-glutamate capsule biosynthesis protein CapA/YwtB (metallophosphatase superfamily)